MLPLMNNMKNGIAKISESTPENEAAICAAATEEKIAVANALKEGREAKSGRKDPNAPLTLGRLAYEAIWHAQRQPWAWDHLHPIGGVPKGYVNPIPWTGVVKPVDWDQLKLAEDGMPPVPVNEMRIRHPNAQHYCQRRLQMYKDVVLAAAEPQYLVLWAVNIGGERWLEAEDLMAEDSYYWKRYQKEFGFSGEKVAKAIGITGHDGPREPSGTGAAPAEA